MSEEHPKPTLTPAAIVREEGGVYGLAIVPALPAGCHALVLLPEGARSDDVLGALMAVRGDAVSYGLPSKRAELERRWPASTGRVTRVDLPLDLGDSLAPATPPKPPSRWGIGSDALTEAEMNERRRKSKGVGPWVDSLAPTAPARADVSALERQLAEERARREAAEAALANASTAPASAAANVDRDIKPENGAHETTDAAATADAPSTATPEALAQMQREIDEVRSERIAEVQASTASRRRSARP
jgi:hypothetical protein